jgi:cytochrome b
MTDDRSNTIRVWDIAVRAFHWSLVVLFTVTYISGETEGAVHEYAGYGIVGLLAFRLVWGVIGTRHARFADFVRGPATVRRYVGAILRGRPPHYLGHNPLGGWMVIALLLSLSLTCWSGLELLAADGRGPLAIGVPTAVATAYADDDHERSSDGDELWEEVHEVFSHLTLILVFLHIGGVVIGSVVERENLVRAMVTGYKRRRGDST